MSQGWPLTIDRARIEAEAIKLQGQICPGMVPEIYFNDQDLALTMMEDLGHLEIMRAELMKMKRFPKFPKQMGEFLAKALFYTSDLGMDPIKKKELTKKFISPELCKITEDLVFTDPYYDAKSNDINPELMDTMKEFWSKKEVRLEVTKLKQIFMTKAQSLLHGDLHTGSIFIDENEMRVFDTEFAFVGPAGFDIGALIGNLILNYASWEGRDDVIEQEKKEYREYLLNTIEEFYHEFEKQFLEVWDKDAREEYKNVEGYKEYYMNTLLKESIGFGGCKTMRRVIGLAHVPDLDSIEDLKRRAAAQKLALKLGENMVMQHNNLNTIEDFTKMIRQLA
jgi:5-methylthioribose kinase